MTLKDLLYRELHGEENLKEQEAKREASLCINEEFDFFVGTKRVETLMEGISKSESYLSGINKAIGFLKVRESKVLNEEKLTASGAKILIHDIMTGLKESVHSLESSVRNYSRANKDKLAKIYSTLLFETQQFGEEFGIEVGNLEVKNKELKNLIEKDFLTIAEEIL